MTRLFYVSLCYVLAISIHKNVKAKDEDMLLEASKYLLSGANLKAKPCENFFNYSCGSWHEKGRKISKVISGDEEYEVWGKKTNQMLVESLEGHRKKIASMKPSDIPDFVKWTLTFYDRCNTKNKSAKLTKEVTIKQLYDYIGKHLGYPDILKSKSAPSTQKDDKSVWKVQADLQKYFDIGLFFKIGMDQVGNPCGQVKYVLKFTPADEITDDQASTIQQQIQNLTQFLKIELNNDDLSRLAKKIASLSSDLNFLIKNTTSTLTKKKANAEDEDGTDESVKIHDFDGLKNISNHIEWEKLFKYLFTEKQLARFKYSEEPFMLANEEYFAGLTKILTTYDHDTVLSFAFWRVMKEKYAALEDDGTEEEDSAGVCLIWLKKLFASSAIRMIFDHKGWNPTHWRTDLEMMFENLRAAFKFFISGADWLDNEDKMNVIKKANHITFYSGIPSWLSNDTAVNRRTFKFDSAESDLENILNFIHKKFNYELDQLISGVEDEDDDPNFDINAYYGPMRITLLLGHMLPPAYHPEYPTPLKYGLLGWVLGHEFFHGFDENHVKEVPPKVKYLLKDNHLQTYETKKSCLKKQISSFCYTKKGKCISGRQTLAETMSDVDGLKIAYMAYKFASLTQSEDPPIPGMISMTPDQIFFLMAGRYRCSSGLNLALFLDREEEHAPSQSRLHIPIRNFRHFARAFKCPLGSPEVPAKTCKVWGDYYGDTSFSPVK